MAIWINSWGSSERKFAPVGSRAGSLTRVCRYRCLPLYLGGRKTQFPWQTPISVRILCHLPENSQFSQLIDTLVMSNETKATPSSLWTGRPLMLLLLCKGLKKQKGKATFIYPKLARPQKPMNETTTMYMTTRQRGSQQDFFEIVNTWQLLEWFRTKNMVQSSIEHEEPSRDVVKHPVDATQQVVAREGTARDDPPVQVVHCAQFQCLRTTTNVLPQLLRASSFRTPHGSSFGSQFFPVLYVCTLLHKKIWKLEIQLMARLVSCKMTLIQRNIAIAFQFLCA